MKQFKVTLTAVFELPDDFEIATSPPDAPSEPSWLCLKRGTHYYHPTFDWLQRRHLVGPIAKFEGPPDVSWSSVDDDIGQEFINATIGAEDYNIEELDTTRSHRSS